MKTHKLANSSSWALWNAAMHGGEVIADTAPAALIEHSGDVVLLWTSEEIITLTPSRPGIPKKNKIIINKNK